MERVELVAAQTEQDQRLDACIAALSGLSRAAVQALVQAGHVRVNGDIVAKSYRVQAGDRLCVEIPPPQAGEVEAQNIPLDVVYEDNDLLVVNKPRGMVVHPAAGNRDGTLVNALLYHCAGSLSGIGGEIRPGIVHRIDKDTSGLLVAAKNDSTHLALSEQFAQHSIHRAYQAVVHGHMRAPRGSVDAAIGRSRSDRKKMAVEGSGAKNAVTHYEVLGEYAGFSHLGLRLETGRTHQIRVHLAHLGHPLAGDPVYGPKKPVLAGGQCLHAKQLGFVHPATGEQLQFDSALPSYFTAFLEKLGRGI